MTVVGTTAYVADYESGLQIIDVSSPSSPVLLGTYETTGLAQGVTVVGTTAYVADWEDWETGLQIIDVSSPGSPVLLGTYDTTGLALGVTVVGTTAYVADWLSGLQIIDLHPCKTPSCYADCDQSPGIGVLDIFDFLCFQNAFVSGCP